MITNFVGQTDLIWKKNISAIFTKISYFLLIYFNDWGNKNIYKLSKEKFLTYLSILLTNDIDQKVLSQSFKVSM